MKVSRMKMNSALAVVAAAFAVNVLAQQPGAAGGTVVTSEPGKAEIVSAVKLSAQVVGIDKATRTVTLKGPKGRIVDVVEAMKSRISTRSSSATTSSRATSSRSASSSRRPSPAVPT